MLTGDFFHFFYDVSLTVPCLKSIKLNRNYVLKRSSTLPEYLWLGSSGYILAGREGGCGRHGEQTDAFVCFDYHQYLLADQPVHISWCIWPGKKTIKAIDMTIFCKTWWSQHVTNESLDWPRLVWPCLLLPSTSSKDKSQKNFRFIF